jgi:glycerate 2-kinase
VRNEKLRKDGLSIFNAGLEAADPYRAVRDFIRRKGDILNVGDIRFDLRRIKKIIIVGGGKASTNMARAVESKLKDRISEGLINTTYGCAQPMEIIKINECSHPIPDENGSRGVEKMVSLLKTAEEHDLVICLISGGGSSLMPAPVNGVSLEDKKRATELLLKCGATIEEINAVRKHLSSIKGGWLAKLAYPAKTIALIISDVVADRLDTIASGPTVPDQTTFQDAWEVTKKYTLKDKLPSSVVTYLQDGLNKKAPETPKANDPAFKRVHNFIVANNLKALQAAEKKARNLGYNTFLLSSCIQGEAREIAKVYAAIAKDIKNHHIPLSPPCVIMGGGETTVTIRGSGKGGRNQEMALSFAQEAMDLKNILFISAGTDGIDGFTDAAGAYSDGKTFFKAKEKGLFIKDFLENNDSYNFFKKLNDLLVTGPTGTNVMDMHLLFVDKG